MPRVRIRFLREAGGIGDVTRCLGVVGAVKDALPDAEMWFYVLSGYTSIAKMCPHVNRVVSVDMKERRGRDAIPNPHLHGYLSRHPGPWDATVDMFCPAYVHERETRGNVYLDRIDCWTAEAAKTLGVELKPRVADVNVPLEVFGWADGWLDAIGAKGRYKAPLVGIQPLSVAAKRSFSLGQVRRMCEMLWSSGVKVLYMHSRYTALKDHERGIVDWIKRTRTPIFVAPDWAKLFAIVGRCDAMITCDSGLYHVAAAMRVPVVGAFGNTSGAQMRKHYPTAIAVDAGPRERAGLPCSIEGRPCYSFLRGCGPNACHALWRMDPTVLASAALGMLR